MVRLPPRAAHQSFEFTDAPTKQRELTGSFPLIQLLFQFLHPQLQFSVHLFCLRGRLNWHTEFSRNNTAATRIPATDKNMA